MLAGECAATVSASCPAGSAGTQILAQTAGRRESGAPVYTFGARVQASSGRWSWASRRSGRARATSTTRICRSASARLPAAATASSTWSIATPPNANFQVYGARLPAYNVVNIGARLPLGFAGLNDDTYFQFNVTNVFDKFYVGNVGGQLLNTSVPFAQLGAPRAFIGDAERRVQIKARQFIMGAAIPVAAPFFLSRSSLCSDHDPGSSRRTRPRRGARRPMRPYSRFSVGCAIDSVDGEIAVGANMENACYRLGICAEIAALTAAQQAFGLDKIARIAVAGGHVGPDGALAGAATVTPCGGCRQAILEAAHVSGRDLEIVAANGDGSADCRPSDFGADPFRLRPGQPRRRRLTGTRQASLISRSRSWRYSSAVIGSG